MNKLKLKAISHDKLKIALSAVIGLSASLALILLGTTYPDNLSRYFFIALGAVTAVITLDITLNKKNSIENRISKFRLGMAFDISSAFCILGFYNDILQTNALFFIFITTLIILDFMISVINVIDKQNGTDNYILPHIADRLLIILQILILDAMIIAIFFNIYSNNFIISATYSALALVLIYNQLPLLRFKRAINKTLYSELNIPVYIDIILIIITTADNVNYAIYMLASICIIDLLRRTISLRLFAKMRYLVNR